MARVGELLELDLTDLGRDGRGLDRHDGQVVFVDGGLPGERVLARVTARGRGHLVGQLKQVLRHSPERRPPPCILADHCGGCGLQPLVDQAQRHWKEEMVRQTLRRIGHLDVPVRPLMGAEGGLGYRNRALIPLERTADGRLRAGYYRRGTHRIVNMNHCPVLDSRIDALIGPLKADLEASGWPVDRHAGAASRTGLRHLGLRLGSHSGELLILLISSHDRLPGLEELALRWMARWPDLVGVVLNLQPLPTNVLLGPESRTIAGRGWLNESFAGVNLRIAADTFFQVNTPQAERVVPLLRQALGEVPGRLVDACSGIGTFSLPLALDGWQVHGIEQQGGAVELARANAARHGLEERVVFELAEVAGVLAERLEGVDALFVDPPRKGLDGRAMEAIGTQPPPVLLYLSCDPATLARDLGRLCGDGPFVPRLVQPFDFFPNTTHVETLVVLDRR